MQSEMPVEGHVDSPLHGDVKAAAQRARWSGATKIAFRFGFVYFVLYNLETALHLLSFPPFTKLSPLYESICWNTVCWVSKHVLHLAHNFATDFLNPIGFRSGSKDTTYAYVQVLCFLGVAAVATLVWSLWDAKRQEYVWLHRWFVVYLRLLLAVALIFYGAIKIFPAQFQSPTPSQLLMPFGNSSPSGLLWISMGAAPKYRFFAGLMEVAAGLLLVVPRLATLGALLSIQVMVNVLMLNIGYEIPVKLLSTNLVLMGIVILLPDLTRLADFFVLNRSIPAAAEKPLFRRKSLNWAALVLQIAFGIVLLSYDLYRSHQIVAQIAASKKTPLYGIWFVDEYVVNGQSIPPLSSDALRWQRLAVESTDSAVVQVMTGETGPFFLTSDSRINRLYLTHPSNPNWIAELTYDNSSPGGLVLRGKMGGLPVLIRLHREDESKFPLNDHEIHWVNDGRNE